jgi:hypothetical protein
MPVFFKQIEHRFLYKENNKETHFSQIALDF